MRSTRKQLLLHRLQASLQQGLPPQVSCHHSLYSLYCATQQRVYLTWGILLSYTVMLVLMPLIEENFQCQRLLASTKCTMLSMVIACERGLCFQHTALQDPLICPEVMAKHFCCPYSSVRTVTSVQGEARDPPRQASLGGRA